MATTFIFHGIGGSPEENWFPSLRRDLELQGERVIVPSFPNSDLPTLALWQEYFQRTYGKEKLSVFIGHSLGATFALRLLEQAREPIEKLILVAGVYKAMGNAFDELVHSFYDGGFSFEKIRSNARAIHIVHGDDDPYVPLKCAEEVAELLGAKLHVIPRGGHLNTSAGFTEFPFVSSLLH